MLIFIVITCASPTVKCLTFLPPSFQGEDFGGYPAATGAQREHYQDHRNQDVRPRRGGGGRGGRGAYSANWRQRPDYDHVSRL